MVLVAEPLARAAEAGEDLVVDPEDAVAVEQLADLRHVLGRRMQAGPCATSKTNAAIVSGPMRRIASSVPSTHVRRPLGPVRAVSG